MKARKLVSATVASLGLVAGLSGFAGATSGSTGSIKYTGAHSYNAVRSHKTTSVKVKNDNDLHVTNTNKQYAHTGDADVWGNTRVGDVSTGNARNTNRTNISATVDNSASSANWAGVVHHSGGSGATGTIHDTGYDSTNVVTSKETTRVNVNNDNDIRITNNNTQTATSGDATVSHNTRVGSVTTGDATNTNDTTIRVDVSN